MSSSISTPDACLAVHKNGRNNTSTSSSNDSTISNGKKKQNSTAHARGLFPSTPGGPQPCHWQDSSLATFSALCSKLACGGGRLRGVSLCTCPHLRVGDMAAACLRFLQLCVQTARRFRLRGKPRPS
mmetsp:Transcript_54868/g.105903  ORF Transcript_54868/g.105903 Transcript_54868/m.105903 type:complete len:127 (+) Transcript_54868:57-437(+)